MDEFAIFENELARHANFLNSKDYVFKNSIILSGNPSIRIAYENKRLSKRITFDFSPSNGSIIRNRISVIISNLKNHQAIDLGILLAYLEKKASIHWKDQEKYFFMVDSKNLAKSIENLLVEIMDVLNNQVKDIFASEVWFIIPTHDSRDDY